MCRSLVRGRRLYDLTLLLASAIVVLRVFGKERVIGTGNAFVALSAERDERLPCYLAKTFEVVKMIPRFSLMRQNARNRVGIAVVLTSI